MALDLISKTSIILQIRDYRNSESSMVHKVSSVDGSPIIRKVALRMSLENVVKDIPSISDNSWTYGDLMVSMILLFPS